MKYFVIMGLFISSCLCLGTGTEAVPAAAAAAAQQSEAEEQGAEEYITAEIVTTKREKLGKIEVSKQERSYNLRYKVAQIIGKKPFDFNLFLVTKSSIQLLTANTIASACQDLFEPEAGDAPILVVHIHSNSPQERLQQAVTKYIKGHSREDLRFWYNLKKLPQIQDLDNALEQFAYSKLSYFRDGYAKGDRELDYDGKYFSGPSYTVFHDLGNPLIDYLVPGPKRVWDTCMEVDRREVSDLKSSLRKFIRGAFESFAYLALEDEKTFNHAMVIECNSNAAKRMLCEIAHEGDPVRLKSCLEEYFPGVDNQAMVLVRISNPPVEGYIGALDSAVGGGSLDCVKILLAHAAKSQRKTFVDFDDAVRTAGKQKREDILDLLDPKRTHMKRISTYRYY